MTEILVLQQPEQKEKLSSNKTEKDIEYDKYKENPSLPLHHYDAFKEMEIRAEKKQDVDTSLVSIQIKSIARYMKLIIRRIPEINLSTKKVDVFKKEKPTDERLKDLCYNIPTQLEHPAECLVEPQMIDMIMPTHTTFEVVGVVVPHSISKNVDQSFLNYVYSLEPEDLAKSGNYGLIEFQSDAFIQSLFSDITPRPPQKDGKVVYFYSDEDAARKIKIIDDYIKYVNSFYENNLIMLYRYLYSIAYEDHVKHKDALRRIFKPAPATPPSRDKTAIMIAKQIHRELSSSDFKDNFIFEDANVFNLLNRIKLLGVSNPTSAHLLKELETSRRYANTVSEFDKLKFKKKLEYAKKQAIALNKFDTRDLKTLTDNQRKIIKLEFDKIEKFYSASKKYGEDFDLVSSLVWAMDNNKPNLIKSRLAEITKKVSMPKDIRTHDSMLKNKSKANLICPHVVDKAQMLMKPYKNEITKHGEIREQQIDTFSLPATPDGFFCRICGELLAERDDSSMTRFVAGKLVNDIMEHDRLITLIWKEVAHIVTTYVKFKSPPKLKPIIQSITNTLRGEIGNIEANLLKIKSNNRDGINNLLNIYIFVYTMAMIVHMIDQNYGKITFSVRQPRRANPARGGARSGTTRKSRCSASIDYSGGAAKSEKTSNSKLSSSKNLTKPQSGSKNSTDFKQRQKRLQNIINNALYLVLYIKNVMINKVLSINKDSIKPMLIRAYKWASTLDSKIEESGVKESMSLQKDIIYKYVEYIQNLHAYNAKNPPPSSTIKSILGRSAEAIKEEKTSIYATIEVPEPDKNSSERTKYKYDNFEYVIEYIQKQLYNATAVPYSQDLSSHSAKYKHLAEYDEKKFYENKLAYLIPNNRLEIDVVDYNKFMKSISINNYYDEKGRPHKFDVLVYQKANAKGVLSGAKKEYTQKNIVEWIDTNNKKKLKEFDSMHVVDRRCSVCGVLHSKISKKTIDGALEKIEEARAFYAYYENVCPKGELHAFTTDTKKTSTISKCSKCGITPEIMQNFDKAYHSKYVGVYNKIQADKEKVEKDLFARLSAPIKVAADAKKYPEWKINNAKVLELSRMFKVSYNTLVNLGMTVDIDHKLIESGEINPANAASDDILRLRNLRLYNHYLHALRMFNIIKNHDIVKKLPFDLAEILKKNKVSNLRKVLDIPESISRTYEYYQNSDVKPFSVGNFLLHHLSTLLLVMYKNMKSLKMGIADDVIKYILEEIINTEKSFSKPDLTEFVKKMTKEDDDVLDNTASEMDDSALDISDVEEPNLDDEDGDISDKFATNQLDMGQDDEDDNMDIDEPDDIQ